MEKLASQSVEAYEVEKERDLMKLLKRGLCGLLAVVLMVPAGLAAPVSGGKNLSDLEGHWAQKEVEAAVASGWVDVPGWEF